MKKNILILASLATVLVSCQKDDFSTNPESANVDASKGSTTINATATRNTYTKKILLEEFVGLTYGDAPEFIRLLNNEIAHNPGRIIKALHHNNDILESPQTDVLVTNLSTNGYMAYPSSLIDRASVNGFRFVGSSNSQVTISQQLAKPANCGIAISSTITQNNAKIDVYETFNPLPNTTCNVTVYLVEDNVVLNGFNYQANNFNNNSKSKFYKKGNPMVEYTHENVVRACITPSMGTPIKQGIVAAGGSDHQTFTIEIPSYVNRDNCYIVAFVTNYTNNIAVDVLNVQQAKLGTSVSMN